MTIKNLRMLLGLAVVVAPLALIGCDEEKKPTTPAAGTPAAAPTTPAAPAEKK